MSDYILVKKECLQDLKYYINNPSAWEGFDQSISDDIEALVDSATEQSARAPGEPVARMNPEHGGVITEKAFQQSPKSAVAGYTRPLYTHPPSGANQGGVPEEDRDKVVWGVYDHLSHRFDFNRDPFLDMIGYLVDQGFIRAGATPQTEGDGWSYDEPPKDGSEFLAYDPDLIDPDFCPDGVVLAMWAEQVVQVAPDRFKDAFIGTVWNDGIDDWQTRVIHPVCWMPKPKPPQEQREGE